MSTLSELYADARNAIGVDAGAAAYISAAYTRNYSCLTITSAPVEGVSVVLEGQTRCMLLRNDSLSLGDAGFIVGSSIVSVSPGVTVPVNITPSSIAIFSDAGNGMPGAPGPQGPAGPQGNDGPIGPRGLMGPVGAVGPLGPKGDAGDTGATGSQGLQGLQGSQGLKGDAGPQGQIGPQGPAGTADGGSPGAQGPQGATGPAGADGAEGPQGPQGIAGPAGSIGATGAVGPQGTAGNDGAAGPQGATGAAGTIGSTGPAGATGASGPSGPQGVAGAKGDTGATGPMGATGGVGPQGAAGVAGATGATGPAGADGAQGPRGFQGVAGNDGAPGAAGAKGDTGAAGATGPSGPAGAQGLTGATGPSGPQGLQGVKGDTGAAGATGAQGLQGSSGPAGAAGATGAAGQGFTYRGVWAASTNYSPYDVVTYNGSTYEASSAFTSGASFNAANWNLWASKGDVGAQGAQGTQGQQGTQGVQGLQGPQGATGPQGPAGSSGGSLPASIRNVNGAATISSTDSNSLIIATGTNYTLTLDTSTKLAGFNFRIRKSDGKGFVMLTSGGNTFDDTPSYTIVCYNEDFIVFWDNNIGVYRTLGRRRGLIDVAYGRVPFNTTNLIVGIPSAEFEVSGIELEFQGIATSAATALLLGCMTSGNQSLGMQYAVLQNATFAATGGTGTTTMPLKGAASGKCHGIVTLEGIMNAQADFAAGNSVEACSGRIDVGMANTTQYTGRWQPSVAATAGPPLQLQLSVATGTMGSAQGAYNFRARRSGNS